jgi:hypothetical protein
MTAVRACTLHALSVLFYSYRLPMAIEREAQAAVAKILADHAIPHVAEYDLGEHGRVDFYSPHLRLGLELKVKGSPSDVRRQLARYAAHPAIDALMLLTTRAHVGAMPPVLGAKPLYVVQAWGSAF